jgi:hypothetical protein
MSGLRLGIAQTVKRERLLERQAQALTAATQP